MDILPALAAAFVEQFDVRETHLPVEAFTHIIYRQAGHGHRRQSLHLDTSAAHIAHACFDAYTWALWVGPEMHLDIGDFHWMTHGDQRRGLFRPHNPSNTGHLEYIALSALVLDNGTQRGRLHIDRATRHGLAGC